MTAPTSIWRFDLSTGSVRLLIQVEPHRVADLRGELDANALVAESLDEFVATAHVAADRAGAMIGEVMKSPWSLRPLRQDLRAAIELVDVIAAGEAMVAAVTAAPRDQAHALLNDPEWALEREFVASVLHGLDDLAEPTARRLAIGLGVGPLTLLDALGIPY